MWIELEKKRAEIVRNYKKFLKCIAKVSKELGCEKVFLTGSFAEGKAVLASDIDVLIVFKKKLNAMERAEIIAEIEERCNLPLYHPFELHVVSEREFEFWKRVFKAKLVEIETNLSTEG